MVEQQAHLHAALLGPLHGLNHDVGVAFPPLRIHRHDVEHHVHVIGGLVDVLGHAGQALAVVGDHFEAVAVEHGESGERAGQIRRGLHVFRRLAQLVRQFQVAGGTGELIGNGILACPALTTKPEGAQQQEQQQSG